VTSTENAAGATLTYAYDGFGRLAATTHSMGGAHERIAYTYGRGGDLLELTSDAGTGLAASTRYTYDGLGRRLSRTAPGGLGEETWRYLGASRRVASYTDLRGVVFRHHYVDAGRLAWIDAVTSAGLWASREFEYDRLGRLITATTTGEDLARADDDALTAFAWDSLGNRTYERTDVGGVTGLETKHHYDGIGQPIASTYLDVNVERQFDGVGRLVRMDIPRGNRRPPVALSLAYAPLGPSTWREVSVGGTLAANTTSTYDALGRLTDQVTAGAGKAELARWRWELPLDGIPRLAGLSRLRGPELASLFQLDRAGRLLGEHHRVASATSLVLEPATSYDDARRLVAPYRSGAADARTYTLDGRHNWLARDATDPALALAATPHPFDGYARFGPTAPVYDQAGALLEAGDRAYAYGAFGQLVAADHGPDGAAAYHHDALGRLVGRRDLVTDELTVFGYDGAARAYRVRPGKPIDLFLDAEGLDDHALWLAGDEPRILHTERAGSVFLVTSAKGEPLEWYDYTAFGEATVRGPRGAELPASSLATPFGFQGQLVDELGLLDMRNRVYDPTWGRFLSRDPLGLAAGTNAYAFVGGAPLAFWDPFGLDGHAGVQPFLDEPHDAPVRTPVLDELHQPPVVDGIEEPTDVQVEHPVHLPRQQARVERVSASV
jgi:RHS repeat-associated protein